MPPDSQSPVNINDFLYRILNLNSTLRHSFPSTCYIGNESVNQMGVIMTAPALMSSSIRWNVSDTQCPGQRVGTVPWSE